MTSPSLANAFKANNRTHLLALLCLNAILSLILTWEHNTHAARFLYWSDFMHFEGAQPFQSRILPFLMAHVVTHFRPLGDYGLGALFLGFDLVATFISAMFLWATWTHLGPRRGSLGSLLFLYWWQLTATFVVSTVHNYYYPWDMISLAFINVGLWIIVAQRPWWWLLPLCLVAMTNRETSVVLPFFYLAFHWRPTRQVWQRFGVLLAACVAVKLGISAALGVTSDAVSLYHVPGYLRFFYNFSFLSFNTDDLPTANVFFAFGGAWILLLLKGQIDPRLQRMAWCFLPFFLGMTVVGNLSEIRIFAEFFPLLALMLAGKFSDASDAAR
jgi:hypothetical protein